MEHKIVSVSVSEVVIEFALNCKCRANVVLTSLCATAGVAFKVQTSSPTKFLVNPPSGIIPPLSNITFQIVLKPQTQLPADYPRSPHDRFLVRAAKLTSSLQPHQSIASWLSSQTLGTTQDIKLKVAFVGPILLQHAVSCGAIDTVKKLMKRRDSVLNGLPHNHNDALREANNGLNRVKVESGGIQTNSSTYELLEREEEEAILTAARRGESNRIKSLLSQGANPSLSDQYGLTALHVAALKGHKEVVELLLDIQGRYRVDIECRDGEGQTPLHLAVEGGNPETVELMISRGADINSTTTAGATPLYIARTMGYEAIARMIQKKGDLRSYLTF